MKRRRPAGARHGQPKVELEAGDLKLLERLAGLGLSERNMATAIGVSDATWEALKKRDPRLSGALEKGRAEAARQVANRLFQLCMRGNLGALIWWEKTRSGRHEMGTQVADDARPFTFTLDIASDPEA